MNPTSGPSPSDASLAAQKYRSTLEVSDFGVSDLPPSFILDRASSTRKSFGTHISDKIEDTFQSLAQKGKSHNGLLTKIAVITALLLILRKLHPVQHLRKLASRLFHRQEKQSLSAAIAEGVVFA